MSIAVANMSSFGDSRTRDVFHRNAYQAVRAADKDTAISVDHTFFGITAADSLNTIGTATQFELVKMQAVESTADGLAGRLDITINDGTAAAAAVKVAELSASNAKFVAATLSADFGSNFSMDVTSGGSAVTQTFKTSATSANDVSLAATSNSLVVSAATEITSTTAKVTSNFGANHTLSAVGSAGSVVQTFATASGGVGDVLLTATSNNLKVTAANVDTTGEITVQGNRANWYQAGTTEGVPAARKAAANVEYNYVHNAGTTGTSTGYVNFNLDPQNASLNAMGAGGYAFKSYNAAGTAETLLAMGAGAAAGQQTIQFSNAYLGVNTAPSTTYRLDVTGDSRVSGNMTVTGDLIVSGTTTTVDTATVQVEDSNINMAYNVSDPAIFNGGGITVGTGASAATLNYNNTLVAWDANIGMNIPTTTDFTIAGGFDTTLNTGVTINESGISFGSDDATIAFGTAAVITKSGLSAASDDFALTLGASAQWRIKIESVGGEDYLSMQYSADGGLTYETKMSVGN
jgi:hypothetical protein